MASGHEALAKRTRGLWYFPPFFLNVIGGLTDVT